MAGDEGKAVTVDHLVEFTKKYLRRPASRDKCAEIISEYDTDGDFELSFQEFQNLVLPMANEQIRKMALSKKGQTYDVSENVMTLFGRIIENEVYLVERKVVSKIKLNNKAEFNVFDQFARIAAKGAEKITVEDIWKFLNAQCKFEAKSFEIEAILRRCDHDSDLCLSLEEFSEIFEICLPIVNPNPRPSIKSPTSEFREDGELPIHIFNPDANAAEEKRFKLIYEFANTVKNKIR